MKTQSHVWLTLLLLQLPLVAHAAEIATYLPAASLFLKRDDSCPANTFECSTELGQAFNGICCQNGQSCALDADNEPACCPSGAVCTGTAPASATAKPTAAASYVTNEYFSFPYAPTTYPDRQACSSAIEACSNNYDVCVTALEDGGQFGVTIDVPGGGGATVDGGGAQLGAKATSVCSSLSSRACSDLRPSQCSDFGDSGTNFLPNILLLGLGSLLSVVIIMS